MGFVKEDAAGKEEEEEGGEGRVLGLEEELMVDVCCLLLRRFKAVRSPRGPVRNTCSQGGKRQRLDAVKFCPPHRGHSL